VGQIKTKTQKTANFTNQRQRAENGLACDADSKKGKGGIGDQARINEKTSWVLNMGGRSKQREGGGEGKKKRGKISQELSRWGDTFKIHSRVAEKLLHREKEGKDTRKETFSVLKKEYERRAAASKRRKQIKGEGQEGGTRQKHLASGR